MGSPGAEPKSVATHGKLAEINIDGVGTGRGIEQGEGWSREVEGAGTGMHQGWRRSRDADEAGTGTERGH